MTVAVTTPRRGMWRTNKSPVVPHIILAQGLRNTFRCIQRKFIYGSMRKFTSPSNGNLPTLLWSQYAHPSSTAVDLLDFIKYKP